MLVPDRLLRDGRYAVVSHLGSGGMGAVYLATDASFRNSVAIKEALDTSGDLGEAFFREARLLRSLKHRLLPSVIDYFQEGRSFYLVMDYVPGEDLHEVLARRLARKVGPFPPHEVVGWGAQLLDVLAYLHAHEPPILHRDVKPRNLKLTPEGALVLLDFGLAKGRTADMSEAAAGESVAGHSRGYAPLEQMTGSGTTVRSDLYSAGATLYHLLTGSVPPDALLRMVVVNGGAPDPLLPALRLNERIPRALSDALARSLAQTPAERFASAAEMRATLTTALHAFDTSEYPAPASDRTVVETLAPPPTAAVTEVESVPTKERALARVEATEVERAHASRTRPTSLGAPVQTSHPTPRARHALRTWASVGLMLSALALVALIVAAVYPGRSSPEAASSKPATSDRSRPTSNANTARANPAMPLKASLPTKSDLAERVAWSPDGTTLATGGTYNHTLKVWDAASGHLRTTFVGDSRSGYSLAWSPDGKTLASTGQSNTIKLWDVGSGRLRTTLAGHSDAVSEVAWSPDGGRSSRGAWTNM